MISVCVSRIDGCCDPLVDKEENGCIIGTAISDVLIQSPLAAESVGRAFLDDEQFDKDVISASCSLHGYLEPGRIVKASDRINGTYQAEINTFSININRDGEGTITAYSALSLKRLSDE